MSAGHVPQLQSSDPRIRVIDTDRRRTAPPCSVRIWNVQFFGVWVGTCDCKCWSSAASGNAFGWYPSRERIERSAAIHLSTMDEARAS